MKLAYSVILLAMSVAFMGCCKGLVRENLPPAQMMMEPGPGVGGPGPGVMMYQPASPMSNQASQVAFVGPDGMSVRWDISMPGQFDSEPMICPGRYNFPQGAIYRMKLTNIPARPGVELYPTLEVGTALPRTAAFLSHNAIPVQFTEEDFDQVLSGNFVSKVIYLPDPEFQELALAGVETLVSTRLDPGVDPIVEADRRGSILAVVRLGNKDLEIPGEDMGPGADVVPASYNQQGAADYASGNPAAMTPVGAPAGTAGTVPMNYISGVTGPQYGMPMCGTPIGLPGPPHIPLGVPAGLRKHVMKNHTYTRMPRPTRKVRIDVKQSPGFSYPRPASRAIIMESTRGASRANRQPLGNRRQVIGATSCNGGGCGSAECSSCATQ